MRHAYCGSKRVDDTGNVKELVLPTMYDVNRDRWLRDFVADGREECIRFLLRENTIPNASAVVFRRDLYDVASGVDERLRLCSDWKFWASLLLVSDLVFVAEPLNYFRAHGKSMRSKTHTWEQVIEGLQVMKYILEGVGVPRDALADLHTRLAIIFLHAYITQRPSAAERVRVRELAAGLEFSFSRRAASGFAGQLLQVLARWFRSGSTGRYLG